MSGHIFRFPAVVQVDLDTFLMVYLNRIEVTEICGERLIELYHDMNGDSPIRRIAMIQISSGEYEALKLMSKAMQIDFIFKNKDRITAN